MHIYRACAVDTRTSQHGVFDDRKAKNGTPFSQLCRGSLCFYFLPRINVEFTKSCYLWRQMEVFNDIKFGKISVN